MWLYPWMIATVGHIHGCSGRRGTGILNSPIWGSPNWRAGEYWWRMSIYVRFPMLRGVTDRILRYAGSMRNGYSAGTLHLYKKFRVNQTVWLLAFSFQAQQALLSFHCHSSAFQSYNANKWFFTNLSNKGTACRAGNCDISIFRYL